MTLTESDLKYLVKQTINEMAIKPGLLKNLGEFVGKYVALASKGGKTVTTKQVFKAIEAYVLRGGGKNNTAMKRMVVKFGVGGIFKLLVKLGFIGLIGWKVVVPIVRSAGEAKQSLENFYSPDATPDNDGIVHHHDYLVDYYNDPANKVDAIRARNREKYSK